jgi:hypothetical protein
LEDANLSALSEHLIPASKSELLSSFSKAEILSSETCAAASVGSEGNLLPPSCSNSIHIGVNLYYSGGLVYCNFRNKPLVLKMKHKVLNRSLLYNYHYVQECLFSLGICKNYSLISNDNLKNLENQDWNSDFL